MRDDDLMYFVTTFSKLEKDELGWYNFGSIRTVGYYADLEDARKTVINNAGDICETIYDYAIIEGVEQGLYPITKLQELYKVKDITKTVDGKEYYNPDLTYEKIDLPKDFSECSLVIG